MATGKVEGGGIGLGTLIAVLISWTTNHSVIWAILHGIFGWCYVLYYVLGYGRGQ